MIVGLTGGIGSGKSTVAKIFARLNVPIYDADTEAKKLLESDRFLHDKLVHLLGTIVKNTDGTIDRVKMAEIIFNNPEKLIKVNSFIHPAVAKHFSHWYKRQSAPYVVREAAILFESGSYKDCDSVITVFTPEKMRIDRVIKRNNISAAEVKSRMANQWPEEEKLKLATFILYNDGTQSVIKQVLDIHENLISRTNTSP